jgi:hypothetical protein
MSGKFFFISFDLFAPLISSIRFWIGASRDTWRTLSGNIYQPLPFSSI